MIEDFDRLARETLDLDAQAPEPPDWDFSGFMAPYDEVMEWYIAWKDHGVMPVAGGYLDQPEEWRRDMRVCRAIYGTRAWLVDNELRLKRGGSGKPSGSGLRRAARSLTARVRR